MHVTPVEGRRRSFGLRGWLIVAAVVLVVLLLSLRGLARFYTDYLWFKDVGFQHTWRSLLSAKIVPAVIFSAAFFVAMLVNLIVADRVAPRYRGTGPEDEIIERYRQYVQPYAGRVRVLVSLFFALIMGTGVSAQWQRWILFSNSTAFGIKDPEFHKDISFYVFRLPFLQFVAGWIFAALLVILIVSAVFHYLNGGIRLQSPFQRVTPQVKVHLSVLLAIMALTKTYQYYLAQFALTKSRNGFVDGATYTDLHAHLPALRLLMVISVAAAGLFIVNIWRRGWVFPIIAVGLWGFISIVVGTIYPAVIQKFTVQPNELSREQPYIERNIAATRDAFKLNDAGANSNITKNTYNYSSSLDQKAVAGAKPTLENVRLYDPLAAQDAFRQQQEILPFYAFTDVDVDRYKIGDETKQPILASVRELNLAQLPDNSWTSQHLVYTHGFGAVAAGANQVDVDAPSYVLSGIPPSGELEAALDQKFTGVYFGEGIGGYAVVDTKVAEQEVGTGGTTKETSYQGDAGVKVSSFLRRAALALRFGDWNLLVSGQVTDKSRVIYVRDIQQRVQQIAPFLKYDADPYPVISGGRIIWVIDAYTTTDDYPYSQAIHPTEPRGSGLDTEFNYVRNSVKVTVDAFDGTVKFYVFDGTDPIINTYSKAFPGMFLDKKAMPSDLRAHVRYPEDIFSAQTEQYALYHITDPVQYFNKQAIWDVAPSPDTSSAAAVAAAVQSGNNGGRNTTLPATGSPIDPLYLTMALPQEQGKPPTDQQFVLQRSFTPRSKGAILSAFMFAESDGDNYGKLVLYQVPNPNAPSPGQAASLIQSDQFISSQFTLLGTQGSRVITGNVQLIPVGTAIVYVRPVWILGSGSATFPRYLGVAAALGSRAVLGYNMQDATQALLSGGQTQLQIQVQRGVSIGSAQNNRIASGSATTTTTVPGGPPVTNPPANGSVNSLLLAAQREFAAANAALVQGDLAGYQAHNKAAQADVAAAIAKSGGTGTPTTAPTTPTTKPPATTTTGAP
jgi:uncharacterized membrane protein (UPF0182 family)